jgi:hypothetical protein
MYSSHQGESLGDAAKKQQEAYENCLLEAVGLTETVNPFATDNTIPNANADATDNTIPNANANANANAVDNAAAITAPWLPTIAPTSPAGATATTDIYGTANNGNNNCLTDSRIAYTNLNTASNQFTLVALTYTLQIIRE